jgi:hypothetical protein
MGEYFIKRLFFISIEGHAVCPKKERFLRYFSHFFEGTTANHLQKSTCLAYMATFRLKRYPPKQLQSYGFSRSIINGRDGHPARTSTLI